MKSLFRKQVWKNYLGYYHPNITGISLCVGLAVVHSLVIFPISLIVRHILDVVIPASDLRMLIWTCAAILILHVIACALRLYIRAKVLRITKAVVRMIREDLLDRYQMPRSDYSLTEPGVLHTRMVEDTGRIDILSNALVAQFLPAVLLGLTMLALMTVLNWVLLLLVVALAPLVYLGARKLGLKVQNAISINHKAIESFNKGIHFVLMAMDLTRIQAAETLEKKHQGHNFRRLELTSRTSAWWRAAFTTFQS